ncbi:retrovirus-related pol polyprotein from transposon TNT 1-94 [Tanacetum coccineum]
MTRSSTKELITPFENPKSVFRSKRRLFETPGLVESSSPELDLFSDIEEHSEEETTEIMTETMEQYMSKTRGNYGSGVVRPKINDKTHFELKGQYLKELRENTFSGSEHEDANEHIEKVLEIVDLFHIPEVTQDQVMLRVFPMSLTGAASRWLRNEPSGSITNWETLKTKFLNKYCPPARTAKKMEEINNFQQEPDKSLFRAWERLDVPTRQILDSKGAIPTKTATDVKITTLRRRDTLEEAYYIQFGAPYQLAGQYRAAGPGFYQRNNINSSYPDQRQTLEESLTKFMAESAKRHRENSNIIKEIRASTDVAIRNKKASIKTSEIQIGQMRKVLQERGIGGEDNKSFDPLYDNNVELNDLDTPLEPETNQDVDFEPTVVNEPDNVKNPVLRQDDLEGFIIIDDKDVKRDVALGMTFFMKYVSCQMVIKKFAHGDKCERIMKE